MPTRFEPEAECPPPAAHLAVVLGADVARRFYRYGTWACTIRNPLELSSTWCQNMSVLM